jgi:hypothetical protein
VTLEGEAVVVEGVSKDEPVWSLVLRAASAPAGEYFVFGAATRPSSLDGLAGLDPATCREAPRSCDLAGLGRYEGSQALDAGGRLELRAGGDGGGRWFFVVARRGAATLPVTLEGTVEITTNGGCSNLDPPEVVVSRGLS